MRKSSARLYDLAAVSPLILLYSFAIAGLVLQIEREAVVTRSHATLTSSLTFLSQLVMLIFFAMQVVLFFCRRLPLVKSQGVLPRLTAAIAANSAFAFLLLPRVSLSGGILVFSTALSCIGLIGSVLALASLGKCFSVTPQARGLSTAGLYRWVRHPLYLFEQITAFGIMWQFSQPYAFLVAVISLALQFPRMRYEEDVLSKAFPAYREYSAHTARLIPGLY